MNAGREMDALVAEKVMGLGSQWTAQQQSDGHSRQQARCGVNALSLVLISATRGRLWRRCEPLIFDLIAMGIGCAGLAGCIHSAERAITAPLAICRAALKALGVEVSS